MQSVHVAAHLHVPHALSTAVSNFNFGNALRGSLRAESSPTESSHVSIGNASQAHHLRSLPTLLRRLLRELMATSNHASFDIRLRSHIYVFHYACRAAFPSLPTDDRTRWSDVIMRRQ